MTEFADRFGPWGIVTGAAQGVGLAFAQELTVRGLGVVLVDRNAAVDGAADGLEGETRTVVTDLADRRWIADVTEACADLEIGIAVANAGISYVGYFLDMTPAERDAMLRVNVDATVDLAALALPPMIERGRGAFVAMSSGSALAGTGGLGLYSATKAFVLNLTEALGWELRDSGVVTEAVIAPAMTTPGLRSKPFDADAMAPVDPRPVVARALDALGEGSTWLDDEGLELLTTVARREAPTIMSDAAAAMYPSILGRTRPRPHA